MHGVRQLYLHAPPASHTAREGRLHIILNFTVTHRSDGQIQCQKVFSQYKPSLYFICNSVFSTVLLLSAWNHSFMNPVAQKAGGWGNFIDLNMLGALPYCTVMARYSLQKEFLSSYNHNWIYYPLYCMLKKYGEIIYCEWHHEWPQGMGIWLLSSHHPSPCCTYLPSLFHHCCCYH